MAEKSAGVIVFRREGSKVLYLVLKYGEGHWDFAKGHVESDETAEETAMREAHEEVGLIDLRIIPGFQEPIQYEFKRGKERVPKEVIFFVSETQTSEIQLSNEHSDFAWLDLKTAIAKVTFPTAKDLLKKADKFLKNYHSQTLEEENS